MFGFLDCLEANESPGSRRILWARPHRCPPIRLPAGTHHTTCWELSSLSVSRPGMGPIALPRPHPRLQADLHPDPGFAPADLKPRWEAASTGSEIMSAGVSLGDFGGNHLTSCVPASSAPSLLNVLKNPLVSLKHEAFGLSCFTHKPRCLPSSTS